MNVKIKIAMGIIVATALAYADCGGGGSVYTSIWFNGSDEQVNTGGDNMYEYGECETTTMGYWYDFDDRKNDKGGSYVLYPFDTTGYYGSLIAPEIENLGYVTIQYVLVDPTTTGQTGENPYNFVGLAFNTVNSNKDPLDISEIGGLCATYTSDRDMTLEVVASASGDASCYVTLPESATPKKVEKAISEFEQPAGVTPAYKLNSCADAFAAAKTIRFKLDGGGSDDQGKIRIFELGPKGTCTGAGVIGGSEPNFFNVKVYYTQNSEADEDDSVKDVEADDDYDAEDVDDGEDAIKAVKAASSVKATLVGRTLSFSGITSDASFEIVSLQGQVVKSGKIASSVSLANIKAGVYMVRVVDKSVKMAGKILVK